MKAPKFSIALGILLLAVSGSQSATIANAQSAAVVCCRSGQCTAGSCSDFSGDARELTFPVAGSSVTAQTQEPPTGFTGACLAPYLTYSPQLPTVCYSPPAGVNYGGRSSSDGAMTAAGTTSSFAIAPASTVQRSSGPLPPSYDSYQVVMTCYPHPAGSSCPLPSYAISKSCCDYGMNLTSLDGKVASGFVFISP